MRRSFLKKTALLFLGLGSLSFKRISPRIDGSFVHIVFFWLKEPESKDARTMFEAEARSYTDNISEIKTRHFGTPADTNRSVVDNTYTYCMVTTFESRKEYDIYADHPLHLKFIENAGKLWEKVLVYDSNPLP